MSLFEINKFLAVIIVALVVIFAIDKIGDYLVNPTIPEVFPLFHIKPNLD